MGREKKYHLPISPQTGCFMVQPNENPWIHNSLDPWSRTRKMRSFLSGIIVWFDCKMSVCKCFFFQRGRDRSRERELEIKQYRTPSKTQVEWFFYSKGNELNWGWVKQIPCCSHFLNFKHLPFPKYTWLLMSSIQGQQDSKCLSFSLKSPCVSMYDIELSKQMTCHMVNEWWPIILNEGHFNFHHICLHNLTLVNYNMIIIIRHSHYNCQFSLMVIIRENFKLTVLH